MGMDIEKDEHTAVRMETAMDMGMGTRSIMYRAMEIAMETKEKAEKAR